MHKVLLKVSLCAVALSTTYFGIQYVKTISSSRKLLMQLQNDIEKIDPRIYSVYMPAIEEINVKS